MHVILTIQKQFVCHRSNFSPKHRRRISKAINHKPSDSLLPPRILHPGFFVIQPKATLVNNLQKRIAGNPVMCIIQAVGYLLGKHGLIS